MKPAGRFHFLRSLYAFTVRGGRLWMVPLFVVLLLVSLLAAFGALAPYTAFLYPL
jgi:hypothetical protein